MGALDTLTRRLTGSNITNAVPYVVALTTSGLVWAPFKYRLADSVYMAKVGIIWPRSSPAGKVVVLYVM